MAIDLLEKKMALFQLNEPFLAEGNVHLDLLRLDLIHPQMSGNKWFKLKYNIRAAQSRGYETLLSFGGPYSNHLHALAYAGFEAGMKTIGIIRGEEISNPTLNDCRKWGMSLQFVSRGEYRHRNESEVLAQYARLHPNAYLIPEGGNNEEGIQGCTEILQHLPVHFYDAVAVSVGSGATALGLARSMPPEKKLLCFSSFKINDDLKETLERNHSNYEWISVFHYGRFGKITEEVRQFKVNFYRQHQVELDYLYTAKLMLGLYEWLKEKKDLNLLAIHTGGLQGNRGFE